VDTFQPAASFLLWIFLAAVGDFKLPPVLGVTFQHRPPSFDCCVWLGAAFLVLAVGTGAALLVFVAGEGAVSFEFDGWGIVFQCVSCVPSFECKPLRLRPCL
jgi:hypothetical protein